VPSYTTREAEHMHRQRTKTPNGINGNKIKNGRVKIKEGSPELKMGPNDVMNLKPRKISANVAQAIRRIKNYII